MPPGPPNRAAPRGALRRWSVWTWITPKSPSSSTGNAGKKTKPGGSKRRASTSTRPSTPCPGQNANNSVRVTDAFMEAYEKDGEWKTTYRTTGQPAPSFRARDLMRQIAQAAWECGDPGLQYDSTINRWHTCKVTDKINASNPCSEYMFLDDFGVQPRQPQPHEVPRPRPAPSTWNRSSTPWGSSSRPRRSWWTPPPTPPKRSPGTATTTAPWGSATPTWVPSSW